MHLNAYRLVRKIILTHDVVRETSRKTRHMRFIRVVIKEKEKKERSSSLVAASLFHRFVPLIASSSLFPRLSVSIILSRKLAKLLY
jgi:hypothetical protein